MRYDRVIMNDAAVQDMLKRGPFAEECVNIAETVANRATTMGGANSKYSVNSREGRTRIQVRVVPETHEAWNDTLRRNTLLKAVDSA